MGVTNYLERRAMEVSSTVEDINPVTKRVQVTVSADEVLSRVEETLSRVAKTAKMKGFRPGKAPRGLVEKLHGSRVRGEVLNELITTSLSNVFKENSLSVVGQPRVTIESDATDGKALSYSAEVQILPSPEITGYDSFEITVRKRRVSDEIVEKELEKVREMNSSVRPLESRTTVQKGDIVNSTLSIEIEGEEASPSEPLSFLVGEGKLPEAVEESVIGRETGASVEVEVIIREDHRVERFRGKRATYRVQIDSLSERLLHELNDDFVANLGEIDGKSVATLLELRMLIRDVLEEQAEREAQGEVSAKILEKILEQNEFMVPSILVDDEIRLLLIRYGLVDPEEVGVRRFDVSKFRDNLGTIAEKRVKSAVVVDRIAAQEEIKLTDEDIQTGLNELADQNSMSVQDIQMFFLKDRDRARSFFVELMREKALDFLIDRATVIYNDSSSDSQADS
jgi:trigger factor